MPSRKEWERLIAAQKASGLSAAEWCRKNNLREHQFCYWRKAIQGSAAQSFVPLVPDSGALELVVSGDLKVRVPANFDALALKRLLGVLRCSS